MPFRVLLGLLLVVMLLVRGLFVRRMREIAAKGLARDEDSDQTLGRQGLPMVISQWLALVYLFEPGWLMWAALPLRLWVRWLGAGVALLGTGLLIWTHFALGHNFFGGLKIRVGHELVTSGPYRWVRHPMYVAFLALGTGYLLLSANPLIGLPWIVGTVIIASYRVGREETMLEEQFGDTYRAYHTRTGRFLPRIRWRR